MKWITLVISIIAFPTLMQAAEQEHKRGAEDKEQQEQQSGCLCWCSCSKPVAQKPLSAKQKEKIAEKYLEAKPKMRPQHLATSSEDMRQIRANALHAPTNTDSAKNEQTAARITQSVAARMAARDLQAMQQTRFLHPRPHQIPEDQIIHINKMGIVEKQIRKKRREAVAQHRIDEDAASMETHHSPRSTEEVSHKTPRVFTFQDATTQQRKDSTPTITLHDSVAAVVPPLPAGEELQLGMLYVRTTPLPGVPDETTTDKAPSEA